MSWFLKQAVPPKAPSLLSRVDTGSLVRKGLTAGATVVAISAASAVTSSWRRRTEAL
jgi:hypothetical protein